MSETYVGVDACPDGWIAVRYDGTAFADATHYDDVRSLWADTDAETVLVDVPIGLREDSAEPRACDDVARNRLAPTRHASVFPTPVRAAVHCDTYEEAKAVQERETGGSLGTQTWAIADRIAELDCFLEATPEARGVVRESHPELCFRALAGGRTTAHSKTGRPMLAFWERVEVLERVDADVLSDVKAAGTGFETETDAGNDDLLDAFALALTASPATGQLRTLPEAPETDERGLPMEMVYARPAGD